MMTAFERWYLGYIDPIEITPANGNASTTFLLSDFVTTGDAIKVEIPHSNGQYLWIENHALIHELDNHKWLGDNIGPGTQVMENPASGIYMYIENYTPTRCDVIGSAFHRPNALHLINASGNYDYAHIPGSSTINNWNNDFKTFEKGTANPISGTNPFYFVRDDYGGGSNISYDTNSNNPSFSSNEGEAIAVEKINGVEYVLYRNMGSHSTDADNLGIPKGAFQPGMVLDMSSNPMITNITKYNKTTKKKESFYLNGLKVEFFAGTGNNIQVKVSYEATTVGNDVRWTGNIILPDITDDSNDDLYLAASKVITLDKSGTANRHTKLNGEFVNPTEFRVQSGSKFHLGNASTLRVKNGSTLIIEDGAEILLDQDACIVIEETGKLLLEGNNIKLNGTNARLIIEGEVITADDVNFSYTGSGFAEFNKTHTLSLGNNSKFKLQGQGKGQRFLKLREEAVINLDGHDLDLRAGRVLYLDDSRIEITDAEIFLFSTDFWHPQYLGNGFGDVYAISGTLINRLDVTNCWFNDMERGLSITLSDFSFARVRLSHFEDNARGVFLSNISSVNFQSNNFENNTIGLETAFVDVINFSGNQIYGSSQGVKLKGVSFSYFNGDKIYNNTYGIKSDETNVYLRGDAEVRNNTSVGVFMDNSSPEFNLTVGDLSCASIKNNTIGVKGENIIFNIDAEIHACTRGDCAELTPNNFSGNGTMFDVCYQGAPFSTVLARSNYWNNSTLNMGNLGETSNNCTGINVNNSNSLATASTQCYVPYVPQDEVEFNQSTNMTEAESPSVNCDVMVNNVMRKVHTQYKNGIDELVEEDYSEAENKLMPVSSLSNMTTTQTAICEQHTNVAHTITKAKEDLIYSGFGGSYTFEWDDNTRINEQVFKDKNLAVFPNPATSMITLASKTLDGNFNAVIYDATGRVIQNLVFNGIKYINIQDWSTGLYFVKIVNTETEEITELKFVVE